MSLSVVNCIPLLKAFPPTQHRHSVAFFFTYVIASVIVGERAVARKKTINLLFTKARDMDRRLYDWMRANHDDLLIELGPARVMWRPVLQVIAALGLLDEHGKQPSRDTAFRTWRRVRRDVAASRERKQAMVVLLAPEEVAPGVRKVADRDASTSDTALPMRPPQRRMHLEIRPARPICEMPASTAKRQDVPKCPTGTGSGMPAVEDTNAQVQRVFDSIGASRTPMPKIIRSPTR